MMSYNELKTLKTYDERLKYLQTSSVIGETTFGSLRHLNQSFYRSAQWRKVRNLVILRDSCCDLGLTGFEILGTVVVHHINPITVKDLEDYSAALNPNNLITVSLDTHNAIHFGGDSNREPTIVVRKPGDTVLW